MCDRNTAPPTLRSLSPRIRRDGPARAGSILGPGGPARVLALAWLHLAVLWAFAFAEPLFGVLSDSPEFFVARGNTRADILVFAIALVVVPPTVLALTEAPFIRLPRVRRGLHLFYVALLAGAFALQVLDDLMGASAGVLLVAAGVLGAGAAAAYALTRGVPSVLTVLGPAPLVFLALFLLVSPVSKLVLPQSAADAAQADVRSRTPVVMVVMDEFDLNMLMNARERVDATRYPSFAALARTSTWYRNATTVAGQTTDALPALLTGLRPRADGLPTSIDYPNTAFTLLGDSHQVRATETATEMCPERICGARIRESRSERLRKLNSDLRIVSLRLLLPEGLRDGLPAVDRTFGDFAEGGRTDEDAAAATGREAEVPSAFFEDRRRAVDRLVRGIRPGARRPGFHFLHAAFPHVPWEYLPSGQRYFVNGPPEPGLVDEKWSTQPAPARLGMQRHLLQAGYADRLVGRIVRRLRTAGMFDRALVIFAADHGVSFRPGGSRRLIRQATGSDIAAVPLFIKYPGQKRGRIDDSMVRTVDVVPTIARELGTRLPWEADGRAITRGGRPGAGVRVFSGDSGFFVELSAAQFLRRRRQGLRRMIGLFGAGDGGAGLYASGPDRGLLGRDLVGLGVAGAAGGRADLDSTEGLSNFRPGAPVVPSFVTGTLDRAAGRPPTRLAVAVNGTVRGVSVSFRERGGHRFATIVPAGSFRRGYNVVDVLRVEGSVGGPRLVLLKTERPSAYRLVERGGRTAISGAGRTLPVVPTRINGFVEGLRRDGPALRLTGWAFDVRARRPVDTIVAFAGSRFLSAGQAALPRPDVAKGLKRASGARLGFRLEPAAAGVDPATVRVFALGQGVATELPGLAAATGGGSPRP